MGAFINCEIISHIFKIISQKFEIILNFKITWNLDIINQSSEIISQYLKIILDFEIILSEPWDNNSEFWYNKSEVWYVRIMR